jgi:hypothetical protein
MKIFSHLIDVFLAASAGLAGADALGVTQD